MDCPHCKQPLPPAGTMYKCPACNRPVVTRTASSQGANVVRRRQTKKIRRFDSASPPAEGQIPPPTGDPPPAT